MVRSAAAVRLDTYVALGSSSTCGTGASDPHTKGYVALLAKALGERFPELELYNLGRAGARLGDYLARWEDVRDARPSLITVLPFTDFAKSPISSFEPAVSRLFDEVAALVDERVREGGSCHVFFGDLRIDPAYVAGADGGGDGPRYRPSDYAMLAEKNGVVARLAEACPAVSLVPVIDQNAVHPEWIGAGGHPNDLGHAYIAGCFRKAIEAWLA